MVVNISPFRDHDKSVNCGLGWLWGRLRWSSCSPPSQFLPPVGLGAATLLSFPALLTGSLPGLTLPIHNLLILLLKTPSQSEAFGPLGCGLCLGKEPWSSSNSHVCLPLPPTETLSYLYLYFYFFLKNMVMSKIKMPLKVCLDLL